MQKYLILLTLLLCILLAACSIKPAANGDRAPSKGVSEQNGGDSDSATKGGTVVYLGAQDADSLNPLYAESIAGYQVIHAVFSGLNRLNDRLEFEPDLAVNVPTIENGQVTVNGSEMTVHYELRKDIVWHDGQPFTAEDVIFTWRAFTNPDNPVISPQGYDQISGIEAPDPYTIIIHFNNLVPDYQSLFNTVLPSHLFGTDGRIDPSDPFGRKPIGTGPFQVGDWIPGQEIVLEAHDAYHGDGPYLDQIIYRVVPDPSVRLTQLKTGEADVIEDFAPGDLDELQAMEDVAVFTLPNMAWEHLDFNLERPLFQDRAVRQALKLAIDMEQIVETVYQGTRQVAVSDQPPVSWAFNPNIEVPRRDVQAAKDLLEEAGWQLAEDGVYEKDGRRLAFTISTTAGHPQREQVEQIIQQQAREAGFDLSIRNYDSNTLFGDILPNRRFDMIMFEWKSGVDPDVFPLWHSSQIPSELGGGGQNYIGYRNDRVDQLLMKAHTTLDREVRREAYWSVQEILYEDVPMIPICYGVNLSAARKELAGFKPSPANNGNLWNAGSWQLREATS